MSRGPISHSINQSINQSVNQSISFITATPNGSTSTMTRNTKRLILLKLTYKKLRKLQRQEICKIRLKSPQPWS